MEDVDRLHNTNRVFKYMLHHFFYAILHLNDSCVEMMHVSNFKPFVNFEPEYMKLRGMLAVDGYTHIQKLIFGH